jgi:glycosyltransferase involved in cell wall biosynthesis
LIEKKGYADQLEIYAALQQAGVDFRATIVGAGPLLRPLQAQLETLGLRGIVSLKGALSYQQVSQLYAESDGFLFTGQIASSGDRDGFPNVIGEAMAHSVPVFSSDVSGTTEGIVDQETGWIIDPKDPASAAACIQKQLQAHERLISITRAAHAWVEANFRVEPNMQRLQAALWNKGLKD